MLKAEVKLKELKVNYADIAVLLILVNGYDLLVLEKPMYNYVKDALVNFKINEVKQDVKLREIDFIKRHLNDAKYTLVLYSNTPLLTSENINLCVDYLVLKQEKLIKLPQGYVFETDYFKSISEIKSPLTFSGDASEFLIINSEAEVGYATEVLQHRIINNFIKQGVQFVNPSNIVVNAYVDIESGSIIYPFNTLSGKTTIKTGTILKSGNTIENSAIHNNCAIANSIIKNSVVLSDTYISPFNTILNSKIGSSCIIKDFNKIENVAIKDNSKIESFNNINNQM